MRRHLAIGRILKEFHNLRNGCVLKSFTAILQRFGKANGDILHLGVRFLGTAHEHHFFGAREALVAILVIQTDAEQTHNLWLGNFRLGA